MTTPTPDDAVRRQFEAWAVEHGLPTERDSAGGYTDDEAQTAWSAVQYVHALEAALSAQPAPLPSHIPPHAVKVGDDTYAWQESAHPAERQGEQTAAPVGVPDGLVLDAEDWAVLRRLRRALPDVGLNGWHRGVTVLDKVLAAAPSAPQGEG